MCGRRLHTIAPEVHADPARRGRLASVPSGPRVSRFHSYESESAASFPEWNVPAGPVGGQVSPAGLERVFMSGMDPTPPIRKRSRDLHLLVIGLEPLHGDVSLWERQLIERALTKALDGRAPKEAPDAQPR